MIRFSSWPAAPTNGLPARPRRALAPPQRTPALVARTKHHLCAPSMQVAFATVMHCGSKLRQTYAGSASIAAPWVGHRAEARADSAAACGQEGSGHGQLSDPQALQIVYVALYCGNGFPACVDSRLASGTLCQDSLHTVENVVGNMHFCHRRQFLDLASRIEDMHAVLIAGKANAGIADIVGNDKVELFIAYLGRVGQQIWVCSKAHHAMPLMLAQLRQISGLRSRGILRSATSLSSWATNLGRNRYCRGFDDDISSLHAIQHRLAHL